MLYKKEKLYQKKKKQLRILASYKVSGLFSCICNPAMGRHY